MGEDKCFADEGGQGVETCSLLFGRVIQYSYQRGKVAIGDKLGASLIVMDLIGQEIIGKPGKHSYGKDVVICAVAVVAMTCCVFVQALKNEGLAS